MPAQASSRSAMALSRDAGIPLIEQLAARYAEHIHQRLLLPGARLPSVRECARRHGVSPHTVVAAYDQLLARGLIEARKHRGFFVRELRLVQSPTPAAAVPPPRPVDATALVRGMFHSRSGEMSPGMGTLPPQWLDLPLLHGALRRAMSAVGDAMLRYGDPAGDERLREVLSRRLDDLGIAAPAGQIVTTVGATHALDIIGRTLLQPGDCVLVDEPGWAVEYARLTRAGLRLLPVPRGADGPDLGVMEALAREHRPKLYATVSVLHNPTGASLPLALAHRVLKLAEAHDFFIVEDDTYAYFAPEHAPRLAALDGLQRTVYVSSFAKILAPGWRVGFLAAPARLVDRLIDTKLLSSLTTPAVLEHAVALCLEQGALRRHADRINGLLASARSRSVKLAQEAGGRFVAPPQGMFGWLDVGMDTERLALALHEEGWLLAPGALFHASPRPTTLLRINFATSQDARFWRAMCKSRNFL